MYIKDQHLNQVSLTYLSWVNPWIKLEWPTAETFDRTLHIVEMNWVCLSNLKVLIDCKVDSLNISIKFSTMEHR